MTLETIMDDSKQRNGDDQQESGAVEINETGRNLHDVDGDDDEASSSETSTISRTSDFLKRDRYEFVTGNRVSTIGCDRELIRLQAVQQEFDRRSARLSTRESNILKRAIGGRSCTGAGAGAGAGAGDSTGRYGVSTATSGYDIAEEEDESTFTSRENSELVNMTMAFENPTTRVHRDGSVSELSVTEYPESVSGLTPLSCYSSTGSVSRGVGEGGGEGMSIFSRGRESFSTRRKKGFDTNEVRKLATEYGWEEEYENKENGVVGFVRGEQRVNVYYRSGTVGTCPNHYRLGKTQLFRRSVTFRALETIFDNLRMEGGAAGGGYYRRVADGDREPSVKPRQWWSMVDDDLFKNYQPDDVALLALGRTFFLVTNDGEPCWGEEIPTGLYEKLRTSHRTLPSIDLVVFGPPKQGGNDAKKQQRGHHGWCGFPSVLALGEGPYYDGKETTMPDDPYFVQFVDGEQEWENIPSALKELLNESDEVVQTLALGPEGAWFCLWEDGSYAWQKLPRKLHDKLECLRRSIPEIDQVTMGPAGEWFLRCTDGYWVSGGHGDQCSDCIDKIHAQGGKIVHIAFGYNSTWLITCE